MKKKTKTKKKMRTTKTSPNQQLAELILSELNETKIEKAVHYLRALRGPK